EGSALLDADFGLRTLCGWMRHKFGIESTPDEFRDVEDRRQVAESLLQRAAEAYTDKEAEYPVLTGISRFTEKQGAQVNLDRDGLVSWVNGRFDMEMSVDDVKLNREELKNQLVLHSRDAISKIGPQQDVAEKKLSELFGDADESTTASVAAGGNGSLDTVAQWLEDDLDHHVAKEDLARMNRREMKMTVEGALDDRFHPEMRRMERHILLNIVDEAWKNHLLTMDHLRSSVGLKGYAQMDPKVEYKREGMRLFDSMWENIGERVTDLIFRMESFNEDFIRSTWVDARTVKNDSSSAVPPPQNRAQEVAQQSNESQDGNARPEPIRRAGPRIGRNDPCPCGSGKKYKSCCSRKTVE
ncbi:MAG: SEC-C metal-binding domain-containing protein, partial [Planctomycetota bacterium]